MCVLIHTNFVKWEAYIQKLCMNNLYGNIFALPLYYQYNFRCEDISYLQSK